MKAGNTALARKKSECMKLHPSQDTARDNARAKRDAWGRVSRTENKWSAIRDMVVKSFRLKRHT